MVDKDYQTPEIQARKTIDELLTAAGWQVVNVNHANIHGARGVAIRQYPVNFGHGYADYLRYVEGKAAGVIEAKKAGPTLSGMEREVEKYVQGLPEGIPYWANSLTFPYQSTGVEFRFANSLEPKLRALFAFHKPKLLTEWQTNAEPW